VIGVVNAPHDGVVCSQETSLPGVGGPAARWVSLLSLDELAASLVQLLVDRSPAGEMRRKGLVQARSCSPSRVTAGVMQAYASAMRWALPS